MKTQATPTRLTVVLDDPALYRRLKIRAAEEGVPAKQIIERALRALFESERRVEELVDRDFAERVAPGEPGPPRYVDWERWDAFQAEADALDEELGPGPADLSDVKHHLYGYPKQAERVRYAAEEPAPYEV